MKKCFQNIISKSIFIALSLTFTQIFAQETEEVELYRSHSLGDEAFRDGDYKSAINFYKSYKEEAFKAKLFL